MGNRKWSRVIAVSQRERHHDVTGLAAIHRHINNTSCPHRPDTRGCFFIRFSPRFTLLHLLGLSHTVLSIATGHRRWTLSPRSNFSLQTGLE